MNNSLRQLVLVLLLGSVVAITSAQEIVTLTTPVQPPSITNYHVSRLLINVDDLRIIVELKGPQGETLNKFYDSSTSPTGASLLTTLNKNNFSGGNNSLIKAIYVRLIADGVLTGSVSGSPQ